MTDIIFELANIIPLSLAAALPAFPDQNGSRLLYFICVLIPVLGVISLHMKKRGRLVLYGTVISLAAGSLIMAGRESRQAFFDEYSWTPFLILLCAGVFIFEETALRHRKLKIVSCASLVSVLMYMLFFRIQAGRVQVAMMLFYLLITAVEETGIRWKREGDNRTVPMSPPLSPLSPLLAVLIILMFFKAPEKPFEWRFVKNAADSAKIAYERLISLLDLQKGWDSKEALMGFSDEGGLKGSIHGRSYPALSVTTDRTDDGRIYLSGRTFDHFDGREWTKTDESETDGRTYDLLLTYAALQKFDPANLYDHIRSMHVTVEYEGVRTALLFVPPKMLVPALDESVSETGDDIAFRGRKKRYYKVTGYRINGIAGDFPDFLKTDDEIGRQDFDTAKNKLLRNDDRYSYEGFLEYEGHVKEIYGGDLQLSGKMKSLLEERLEGCEGDAKKLSAAEEMLSEMRYDTDPGQIPEEIQSGPDFLDWLMFEKQSGYCVHYATAFVLIARSMGMPARFVQGYSVKPGGRHFDIMSTDAHAWPEVYLKGKGWMIYEPTPGFRAVSGWGTQTPAGQGTAYGSDLAKRYAGEDSYDGAQDAAPADGGEKIFDPKKALVPAALVLVFLIAFFFIDRLVRRYRYNAMDEREKIISCAQRSVKLMKKYGLVLQDGETVSELSMRAHDRIPQDLLGQFEIYEKTLYSDERPGWKDVLEVEKESRELARFIRRQKFAALVPLSP